MPTNSQRIGAVLTTGAILLGGGWLASQMVPANATAVEAATENDGAISSENRTQGAEPVSMVAKGNSKSALQRSDAPSAQYATMPVTIKGIRNGTGEVYVIVFDNAQAYSAYDVEKAVGLKVVNAKSGSVTVEFDDLPQGAYAVSVFHDENSNEDFDMVDGYPAEGYGTSRAKGPYDEPSFTEASVPAGAVTVQMHYLQ